MKRCSQIGACISKKEMPNKADNFEQIMLVSFK